eukprot:3967126-Amphidinium_carterae.1
MQHVWHAGDENMHETHDVTQSKTLATSATHLHTRLRTFGSCRLLPVARTQCLQRGCSFDDDMSLSTYYYDAPICYCGRTRTTVLALLITFAAHGK